MKITVIGGGSSYTPELVNGFLSRVNSLPLSELCLMDIDDNRLEIVGGFARRMAEARENPFEVVLTSSLREAIKDSSYVIVQLRVGQMEARRGDEYLGQRHGLVGQETTGVGGMAKALRTIPVILEISKAMQELAAPGTLLVNFTNPAGLITQALCQYGHVPTVGVCNVPMTTSMEFISMLEAETGREIDPSWTELNTLGLNHLTWHRGFTVNGEEMWPSLLPLIMEKLENEEPSSWDQHTLKTLQMLPNYYLQYYYYTERKLEEQGNWPPSRAEQVIEIEKNLLRDYADPNLVDLPAGLMQRGGAYYSTAATQLIASHYNDCGETHVVNVENQGAVKEWPEHWVLEMPAKISRDTITPLPAAPLPPSCFGLIAQIKSYELLTVEAAVHGDRNAAYQALLAHPLGPAADKIQAVLDDMLNTNRQWLPQFFESFG